MTRSRSDRWPWAAALVMAAAALGMAVEAVDADPVTVAVATMNLMPFPEAAARLDTAEGFDIEEARESGQGIWMDPARRTDRGRRLYDPEECSPPPRCLM